MATTGTGMMCVSDDTTTKNHSPIFLHKISNFLIFFCVVIPLQVPLIGLLNRTKWIFVSMIAVFLVARISLSTTNVGFPYTDDSGQYPTPQRHYISVSSVIVDGIEPMKITANYLQHTVRTVYGENGQEVYADSGFWVRQIDRNTKKTVESLFAPEIPISQVDNIACSKTIFCGLPFHSMRHLFSTYVWIVTLWVRQKIIQLIFSAAGGCLDRNRLFKTKRRWNLTQNRR